MARLDNNVAAIIIACPDADQESCFDPPPPALQDLSSQQPARRVIVLDWAWEGRHDRLPEIRTEPGMTGIPKPVGHPSKGDPWQVLL